MPGPGPASLLLLLLLLSARCPRPAAQGAAAPIGNLRVHPGNATLTWDLLGNASGIQCFKGSYATHNTYCERCEQCGLGLMPACAATNYTVSVARPPFSAWVLFPPPDGDPGAAAWNLSCGTRDGGPVLCAWAVGPGAPSDVQYRLAWRDLKLGRLQGGCARYDTDARGRNIGCRLDAGAGLLQLVEVVVRGSSKAGRVPCVELSFNLKNVETFSPPNITTECNRTQARMSWAPLRSRFPQTFEYELLMQQIPGRPSIPERTSQTWFQLPNPGTYSAQIRARPRLSGRGWTAWSAPQTFVCDPSESSHARLWRTALLAALGTVLLAVVVVAICRRSGLLARVFPRLPHMKNPLDDGPRGGELMPCEASQEDCPVIDIQLVREDK